MNKNVGSLIVALVFASMGAASAATYDGTLVDVAQYATGDQGAITVSGMSTMHEAMMRNDGQATPIPRPSPMGGMMAHAGMMRACLGSLGLLTKDGALRLLFSKQGTVLPSLCGKNGSHVQVSGKEIEKGGVRAISVDALRFQR